VSSFLTAHQHIKGYFVRRVPQFFRLQLCINLRYRHPTVCVARPYYLVISVHDNKNQQFHLSTFTHSALYIWTVAIPVYQFLE